MTPVGGALLVALVVIVVIFLTWLVTYRLVGGSFKRPVALSAFMWRGLVATLVAVVVGIVALFVWRAGLQ